MYWRTPVRQLESILAGANERLIRKHNELAWLAWHIAALSRAKKLPPLKKLIAKMTTRKRQTWQEQMAIMDQWVAHTQRIARQRKKRHGK